MHLDVKMKAAPLHIGSIFGSLLASWIVLHSLHAEDRVSVVQGVLLLVLGFIFYISSFDLSNYVMFHTSRGKKFTKKYNLSLYDVMDISNKVVSAIQAVICSCSGLVICTYSCSRNMLRTSHYMSNAYAWFGAAYFIYDIYSMYVIHLMSPKTINRLRTIHQSEASHMTKVKDYLIHQPVIIFHHVFIGFYGFLVVVHLRRSFGDCVFGAFFLMECSTPFVSFRGILSRLQLKESHAYVINGTAMIVVFFLCRILLFVLLFASYSAFIESSLYESFIILPMICKVSLVFLVVPQVYWFWLMTRGALKMFLETPAHKQDARSKEDAIAAESKKRDSVQTFKKNHKAVK